MQLAARPPADTVLLVTGELEPKSQQAAWVKEFERCGTVVVAPPMTREQLPRWIARRLGQRGITLAADAAQLLADRVEGNLLAAQQEIERIALLRPNDTLDVAAVAELVADNARFDVFELAGAAFAGDAPRALRILDGLRGEGREPPLILWALLNDLRAVSRVLQRGPNERNLDGLFRAENVWGSRQGPIRVALRRLRRPEIDALLVSAARADRVAKGSLRGDPWVELTGLVARIAGVQLVAAWRRCQPPRRSASSAARSTRFILATCARRSRSCTRCACSPCASCLRAIHRIASRRGSTRRGAWNWCAPLSLTSRALSSTSAKCAAADPHTRC
jgi:DNA polymerase-3 subunit delta